MSILFLFSFWETACPAYVNILCRTVAWRWSGWPQNRRVVAVQSSAADASVYFLICLLFSQNWFKHEWWCHHLTFKFKNFSLENRAYLRLTHVWIFLNVCIIWREIFSCPCVYGLCWENVLILCLYLILNKYNIAVMLHITVCEILPDFWLKLL